MGPYKLDMGSLMGIHKKKINVKSSKKAELLGMSDYIPYKL